MRIRIVSLMVVVLFALTPSVSSANSVHQLNHHFPTTIIKEAPVIYRTPAEFLNKLRAFYAAIIYQREWKYIEAVAANVDAEKVREAAQYSTSMPTSWQATAICEEGGRNDPNYGYFGIMEWNGFHGYPTAGSAPLSEQLAWEASNGISPPDAPGQCHSY